MGQGEMGCHRSVGTSSGARHGTALRAAWTRASPVSRVDAGRRCELRAAEALQVSVPPWTQTLVPPLLAVRTECVEHPSAAGPLWQGCQPPGKGQEGTHEAHRVIPKEGDQQWPGAFSCMFFFFLIIFLQEKYNYFCILYKFFSVFLFFINLHICIWQRCPRDGEMAPWVPCIHLLATWISGRRAIAITGRQGRGPRPRLTTLSGLPNHLISPAQQSPPCQWAHRLAPSPRSRGLEKSTALCRC